MSSENENLLPAGNQPDSQGTMSAANTIPPQQPSARSSDYPSYYQPRFPVKKSSLLAGVNCILLNFFQEDSNFQDVSPTFTFKEGRETVFAKSYPANIETERGGAREMLRDHDLGGVSGTSSVEFGIGIYRNLNGPRGQINYAIAATATLCDGKGETVVVRNVKGTAPNSSMTSCIIVQWAVKLGAINMDAAGQWDLTAWDQIPLAAVLMLLRRQSYITFNNNGEVRKGIDEMHRVERSISHAFPGMQKEALLVRDTLFPDWPVTQTAPAIQGREQQLNENGKRAREESGDVDI